MKTSIDDQRLKKQVYWNLTPLCNLKCGFCKVHQHGDQGETQFVKDNLGHFKRRFSELPGSWEFFIGGGEPLMFPALEQIIEDLAHIGHSVSIATNLTASQNRFQRLIQAANGQFNKIVASFKPGIHDFADYLDKALIVNKHIKAQGGSMSVGAVATRQDIDALYDIGLEFQANGISFRLQVERVEGKYRECTKDEEKKIRYFGRTYGLNGSARYKGRHCQAGMRYFVLTPFGHAFRCHSAIVAKDLEHGYLGNILEDSFRFFEEPDKCTYEGCNCVNAKVMGLIAKGSSPNY